MSLLSSNLRHLRKKKSLTQAQLAEKIDKIDGTAKFNQLRERTLGEDVIFPSTKKHMGEGCFCKVELVRLIFDSWLPNDPGDTKVVHSLPSTGKTTHD